MQHDLTAYRQTASEQQRTTDLLRLTPTTGPTALDVGARDGHFSWLLAERFEQVTALDLQRPQVNHPRVRCVQGDASAMPFADRSMSFVLCAEVLEHVPPALLPRICTELTRVCGGHLLVGVPFREDTRVGRTTCAHCGGINPPWGHVNTFDEARLRQLFDGCLVQEVSYVGSHRNRTNAVAAALMDLAGNPYGTYVQDEACIHCHASVGPAPSRHLAQRVATRLATWARKPTTLLTRPQAHWIHVLFARR